MFEYKMIINRIRQSHSARQIANDLNIGRNKITQIKELARQQGWLEHERNLPCEQELQQFFGQQKPRSNSSLTKPYEGLITSWVEQNINATTIHQHLVSNYGFEGSYYSVQRFAKKIRTQNNINLTVPLNFQPAQAAQVDFGKGPKLFDKRISKEHATWYFVMTLCWSRHQYVELICNQDIDTWLNCHVNAFQWFGGVPRQLIIDNAKCAIIKACYSDPTVQRSYSELALSYGFIISACPPREPQKKGRVESGVKYVKNNFEPLRKLASLQDANLQLKQWVLNTAGNRTHGTTFEKPMIRFTEIEKNLLLPLPTTAPEIAIWQKARLYRDCHVRYLNCRYSAPYDLYNEELWMKITNTTISIYHNEELKAKHARAFKPGQWRTKQLHLPDNARYYLERDHDWCLQTAKKIGPSCSKTITLLLDDNVRDLLRQAQLILRLEKKYSSVRLENACSRALAFSSASYKTINNILRNNLDDEPFNIEDSFNQLNKAYTGNGVYQRKISELLN